MLGLQGRELFLESPAGHWHVGSRKSIIERQKTKLAQPPEHLH